MNQQQMTALAKVYGLSATATAEEICAAAVETSADVSALTGVARTLGLEEGATAATITGTLTALRDRVVTAEAELAKADDDRAELRELRVKGRIDKATAEGKIVAGNKEWATALAAKDPEEFDAWSAATAGPVPTTPATPPRSDQPRPATPADADTKAAAAKFGMSVEEFTKYSTMTGQMTAVVNPYSTKAEG
jgi:phage I-like protein